MLVAYCSTMTFDDPWCAAETRTYLLLLGIAQALCMYAKSLHPGISGRLQLGSYDREGNKDLEMVEYCGTWKT